MTKNLISASVGMIFFWYQTYSDAKSSVSQFNGQLLDRLRRTFRVCINEAGDVIKETAEIHVGPTDLERLEEAIIAIYSLGDPEHREARAALAFIIDTRSRLLSPPEPEEIKLSPAVERVVKDATKSFPGAES